METYKPRKITKQDAPADLLYDWSIANSYFDDVWQAMGSQDMDLTETFTSVDDYDLVLVRGNSIVYNLVRIPQSGTYDVYEIGSINHLTVYVNPENTGLEKLSDLELFRSELADMLVGVPVVLGTPLAGKTSMLEWVQDNPYLLDAWRNAAYTVYQADQTD
jgi:hypothetical protein